MFFKSKSLENCFQTKDPAFLIILGSLLLFLTAVFCALDGASPSSAVSFGLVLLLNIPIYASLFKYEPDFKKPNDYTLCDFELFNLSGNEESSLQKNDISCSQLCKDKSNDETDVSDDFVTYGYIDDDGGFSIDAAQNKTDRLFIGYGYEFLPKHARHLQKLLEQGLKQLPYGKGSAQIHNLQKNHTPLFVSLQNIKDHAIVFGTTGSGKTRFFDLLITQAIERNDTVIIIDPKGDHDLKHRAQRICTSSQRKDAFQVLDIKTPKLTTSSFNLFGSSTSSSDIADKISALMKKSTSDIDSFASYGQEAVACAVTALDCLDLPVDIYNISSHTNIESYFNGMVAGLSKLTARAQNRDIAVYFTRLLKGYGIEKHLYSHIREFLVSIGDEALLDGIACEDPDILQDPKLVITMTAEHITTADDTDKETADKVKNTCATINDSCSQNTSDDIKETQCKTRRKSRTTNVKAVSEDSDNYLKSENTEAKNENRKTATKKKNTKAKNCKIQVKAAAFLTYYNYLKQHTNLDADPEFEKLVSMTIKDQSFFDRTTASIKTVLNTLNSYDLKQIFSKTPAQTDFSDIYKKNKVFYCALHSMSNATLSSYVGKLLLSDLSSFADHIYSMDEDLNAFDNHSSNDKFHHADVLSRALTEEVQHTSKTDQISDLSMSDFSSESFENDANDPDAKAALELTNELVDFEQLNKFICQKKELKDKKALRYKSRNPDFCNVKSILQTHKSTKIKERRKVSIFIDEASEVVNEALVQLLNKARGADFSITIATQTFSDLAKRCGSKDAAMQLIGNCNTMYALRVKDEQTAGIITSTLPTTTFYTKNVSTGTMADTYKESYRESSSVGANTYIDRLFPSSALMELPNFEYVAKLSDGRFVKGVIPILTDK